MIDEDELDQQPSLLLPWVIVQHEAADPQAFEEIIILRPLYRRAKFEYRNALADLQQRFDQTVQQSILNERQSVLIVELSLTANNNVLDGNGRIHTLRASSTNWQQSLAKYVHDWWCEADLPGPLIVGYALELEIFEAAAALCHGCTRVVISTPWCAPAEWFEPL